jgi:hypothetical protein
VHQFEVLPESELVVLSFHTVPEEDLREVSVAGECTYSDPTETQGACLGSRRGWSGPSAQPDLDIGDGDRGRIALG